MGSYGKVASLSDLPPEAELAAKLTEARARIDAAGTARKRAAEPKPNAPRAIDMPEDFTAALADNPAARKLGSASPPRTASTTLSGLLRPSAPKPAPGA